MTPDKTNDTSCMKDPLDSDTASETCDKSPDITAEVTKN